MKIACQPSLNRFRDLIDIVILGLLGVFCFAFAQFASDFAEWNVQLSFLNFPIFVGEILLFICLVCLMGKWGISGERSPTFLTLLIFIYVLFIVSKAIVGYWLWGPLALRDAAFFYYALFSLVGFASFQRKFFRPTIICLLMFVFLMMLKLRAYGYSIFPLIMLSALMITRIRYPWMKMLGIGLLLIVIPYDGIFDSGRTRMISNFLGIVSFLGLVIFSFSQVKRSWQIVAIGAIVFLLVGLISQIADRHAIRSMTDFAGLQKKWEELNKELAEKEKSFQKVTLVAKVYHRNAEGLMITQLNSPEPELPLPGPDPLTKFVPAKFDNVPSEMSEPAQSVVESFGKEPLARSPEKDKAFQILNFKKPRERSLVTAYNNIFFRIFIWRDMLRELKARWPIFGFDFGYPLRSPSIEMLGWAEEEWGRDGWITAHNSYLYAIYRGGIFGMFFIAFILATLADLLKIFLKRKSLAGMILFSVFVYWLTAASTSVFFELPYKAILFWSLLGMALAYAQQLKCDENPPHS
jgi:hypothetical protein